MKTRLVLMPLLSCLVLSSAGARTGSTPAPLVVTNGADDGAGSLRAAIRDAPSNSSIQITFTGVIVLTSGELLLDKNLTIAGPGSAIGTIWTDHGSGPAFRIMEVNANTTIDLSGLTLSYGNSIGADGGAILNGGIVTLHDIQIANCTAFGVFTFPIQGIANGGGFVNLSGATLVATNCSFTGNRCNGSGGGILSSGNLTLKNCTISGNVAGYGGGVYSGGSLTMINCTVNGNSAIPTGPHGLQGGYAGGMQVGSPTQLISCTIASNTCVWNGGGIAGGVTMTNCIVAGNTAQANPEDSDVYSTIQSLGYNLIGVSRGSNGLVSTDLVGTLAAPLDPKLGPLQDNGGLTFTRALRPDSPAIDHGISQGSTTTDQRGMPRTHEQSRVTNAPGGDGTDIGAYELESSLAIVGNISTRLSVGTGDSAMIGGFIITGTQPKTVIIRGIGPSLAVSGALSDPVIDIYSGASADPISTNDNWNDADTRQQIIDSGLAPTNGLESALWGIINPGAYTVAVHGKNNASGIGLFEVYDLDATADSKLANISTRGFVDTGDKVMVGGTIIVGSASTKVLLRAIGPSLTTVGVPNALSDPVLELHDANGALIAANDNWRTDQEAEIIATTIPPSDDLESAIVRDLTLGSYTAIVRGGNNTTGMALVEVYALN